MTAKRVNDETKPYERSRLAAGAKTFKDYVNKIYDQVGTDRDIGKLLGFPDGSRVGRWRTGDGRPDELNCIKLARWTGDDPLAVLRLAGYTEMADLLEGRVGPPPIPFTVMRPHIEGMVRAARSMLALIDQQE
jgi:hypothetical protein